ncbi:pyridoxal-phosphate-dependent aminotransferase family protein [Tabrizicola oligotrophica]|uniref:Aminotransferase class V-fold PLP-dependent enzyme n=1 Tax=Tabrizicola oligotrophica TaxID=2710650 RepID=A0A6M0QSD9_9RHOB|nr:aminotransferase class V-fold PLP-dependent enzyme [Tabrizicola oligotrophica]NEY89352.1 aminotransferase class V-fold PLP-dependent enzyme [Tabrizicola oligotrophica]
MTLAHGRPYLAIPGPSVVPDRIQNAMHRTAPNIYDGELIGLVGSLWPDLRALAGTAGNVACYIGNGHALWEAVDTNLFSRGDKVLLLASGLFGLGWANVLTAQGVAVEVMDFGRHATPDLVRVEARLAADDGQIKAVLTTHVDTASSARTDIAGLRAAMDRARHPALLGVDCIASMGCDEFRMDDWGVDIAFAASQKGLMLPPGMGFVWFSEKARAVGATAGLRTPYWDWTPRADGPEFWQYWHGTAPTHHLYGLREALSMILRDEGLPNVWARHEALARTVWAAFDAWGQGHPRIGLNMAEPPARARAVTAARFGAPDAARLRHWCETQAGVTLGIGLGMATEDDPQGSGFLRVAHMGHVNAHMTLGVLAVMQAGLQALAIPHGAGALEAATAVVAAVRA